MAWPLGGAVRGFISGQSCISAGSTELRAISATTRPDGEHVDHVLGVSASEDHPPIAHTQPPQPLFAAEPLDVSIRQRSDRGADALPITTAQAPQRLEGGGADLDPPPTRISQGSAPPRRQTKARPAPGVPRPPHVDPRP
jgi:hypothetical protein